MTITLRDDMTYKQAQAYFHKVSAEEKRLRTMGGNGNYANIQVIESFRLGHSLDSRDDKILYKVTAEVLA